jgi:hypothetical protein
MKSKHGLVFMFYVLGNVFISEFVEIVWINIVFQVFIFIGFLIFIFGKDDNEVTK